MIAGILVEVACDLARGRVWTAPRFEWACAAVELGCTVAHRVVAMASASGQNRKFFGLIATS
jgi:hypothetical protein